MDETEFRRRLQAIRASFEVYRRNTDNEFVREKLKDLLESCIHDCLADDRYNNDKRLLKVYIIYADVSQNFQRVLEQMQNFGIGQTHALFYEAFAFFKIAKDEDLHGANKLYTTGINMIAEPIDRLQSTYELFKDRVRKIVEQNRARAQEVHIGKASHQNGSPFYVDPYMIDVISNLLQTSADVTKFNGYWQSKSKCLLKGNLLQTLEQCSGEATIKLGDKKYSFTGKLGKGSFARVYKAYIQSNPSDVLALKIQRDIVDMDLLLWEFYMYRQLDKRLANDKRSSFGNARDVIIYSDCCTLVCDFLPLGTLLECLNTYLNKSEAMEEVVCMYYTMEMLGMLETLHSAGLMHGDFKADNMLVRYARDELTVDGFRGRTGPWSEQGLCLVDWGKGIDIDLFPKNTEFVGDCRTADFQSPEMLDNRPWKYQADTYALCVNVYTLLFGEYMTLAEGVIPYTPNPPESNKRGTPLEDLNLNLWEELFSSLLNIQSSDRERHLMLLRHLKNSFEEYMCSDPERIRTLIALLANQKDSLGPTPPTPSE